MKVGRCVDESGNSCQELSLWSRPPGRRPVVAEPSEWVRSGSKSVRMCLFGVKVVASRFLMCIVGYVMGER